MKTIRISKAKGKGALAFQTIGNMIAYEMELSGRVIFLVSEGTNEHGSLSKAPVDLDRDYDQILPALEGAAFRILEETDYKVTRISKLQASVAKELEQAIVGSQVKLEIDPKMKEKLDSVEKDTRSE